MSPTLGRFASTLVLVEHDGSAVNPATLNTVTAASRLGGPVHALVAGDACQEVCCVCFFLCLNYVFSNYCLLFSYVD